MTFSEFKTRPRKASALRYEGLSATFFVTRFLYNIGFALYAFFYAASTLFKKRSASRWQERLGRISEETRLALTGKRVVWIQAVSVGEVVQAFRLTRALKAKAEGLTFVVTTTTPTGKEVALKLREEQDIVLGFPVDFTACIRSFIKDVRPEAMIILETEIWPNLLIELSERGIPVFLVNGRISDRAFPKYQRVEFFLRDILPRFQHIAAQDERMRERFLRLGASASQLSVTGSMKFDWRPHTAHETFVAALERQFKEKQATVWIAGSTHAGEEKQLFDVYQLLRTRFPGLTLIVAPRHLDRLEAIERLAGHMQLEPVRLREDVSFEPDRPVVYLVDKMGILAELYQVADIVFIGGSLVPFGGHNLVEPAFYGKPILVGSHTHNFREMVEDFKSAKAVTVVGSESDLYGRLSDFLTDPQLRISYGERARSLVATHGGATESNAQKVAEFLRGISLIR